jgi:hypothetical protein
VRLMSSRACISTMIRTPYIRYYRNHNLVCKLLNAHPFLGNFSENLAKLQIMLVISSFGPTLKHQSVSWLVPSLLSVGFSHEIKKIQAPKTATVAIPVIHLET